MVEWIVVSSGSTFLLLLSTLVPACLQICLEELAEGSLELVCPFTYKLHPNTDIRLLGLES